MNAPLLGQAPSHLLVARGQALPGWPQAAADIGEEQRIVLVHHSDAGTKVLRLAFLGLTLFSIAALSGRVFHIFDEGRIGLDDAVTVVSAALLIFASWSQLRSLLAGTRIARWLMFPSPRILLRANPGSVRPDGLEGRSRSGGTESVRPGGNRRTSRSVGTPQTSATTQNPPPWRPPLLNQSQPSPPQFTALAAATRRQRTLTASRRLGRRLVPVAAVLLGASALVASLAVFYLTLKHAAGLDPEMFLSGLFVLVSLYGFVQYVRYLCATGWRGSPFFVLRRVYYDGLRLYSNSSILAQLGSAGAVTAVVVSAGFAPIAFPRDPGFVIYGYDAATNAVIRVDPYALTDAVVAAPPSGAPASPLVLVRGSTASELDGTARYDAVQVFQDRGVTGLALVTFSTGERRPLRRLDRPVAAVGAVLQADHSILLATSSGDLWRVDPKTGATTQAGRLDRPIEALARDPKSWQLVAVAAGHVLRYDGVSLTLKSDITVDGLDKVVACGLGVYHERILVADETSRAVVAVFQGNISGTVGPSPLSETVCGITIVPK